MHIMKVGLQNLFSLCLVLGKPEATPPATVHTSNRTLPGRAEL
jgi:hypothetical protein